MSQADQTPSGLSGPGRPMRPVRMGDFELRREVGRGGMGTVYEAWQISLQRVVALKLLASQISSSPKAVLRFQREAQAAAKLHHTHIVPIFAQGDIDGTYYYAMEFVSGESLHNIITDYRRQRNLETASEAAETIVLPRAAADAGGLGSTPDQWAVRSDSRVLRTEYASWEFFREAATHIAAMADALEYAHREGVIHRDIKPHNLILGEDGRMRISDFGLARVAQQPGVTVTGELVGSPLYMSPEQVSGDPGKVDPRADIYSLGATLYEWLTLYPPYPGETREQVISRILSSEALPLRAHNEAIPIDLETIALKAIERDPDRRYRTAAEFRDDLRRFLAKEPIVARRAGVGAKAVKYIRKHQVAALATVSAVVAIGLGTAAFVSTREAETNRVAAIDATAAAVEAAEQNALLSGYLKFLQANPVSLAEGGLAMVEGLVSKDRLGSLGKSLEGTSSGSAPFAGTPPSIAFALAARMYSPAPPALENDEVTGADPVAGLLGKAAELWTQSAWGQIADLVQPYLTASPQDFSAQELWIATLLRMLKFEDAVAATGPLLDSPNAGRAFVWRGLTNILLNKPNETLQDVTQALIHRQQSPWVRIIRGLAWIQLKNEEEALRDFDSVLEESPDFLPAHLGKASAFLSAERYADAVQSATRVLELDSSNADALTIRGDGYIGLKDAEAAERDYRAAMAAAGQTSWLYVKWWAAYSQKQSPQPAALDSADTSTKPEGLPGNSGQSHAQPSQNPQTDLAIPNRERAALPATTGLHWPFAPQ